MVAVKNPFQRLIAGAQPRQASQQRPGAPQQNNNTPAIVRRQAAGGAAQNQLPQGFIALSPQQQYDNYVAASQGQQMPHFAGYAAPPQAPQQQAGSLPQRGLELAPHTHFASRQEEQFFDEEGQFNPRGPGHRIDVGEVRRAVQASTGRMYDKRGQMNAYDNQDALHNLAFMMGNLLNKPGVAPRVRRQASVAEKEKRVRTLKAAMLDPSMVGMSVIGQELSMPIKDIVDYEGWIRRVLRTRTLAQSELFRITKDVRSTAFMIGQDGQSIESRVRAQYLQPSHFKVTSFTSVDIADIYEMSYDVLDRIQDTARQEIELEEDKRGVKLIDDASTSANALTTFPVLSLAPLEAVRYQVERHRLVVDKFLVNRQEVSDVITTMSTQVDAVTQRELNLAGYWGSFLGAVIMTAAGTGVEEVISPGTIYAVASPEYLGELGIRIELFSEPYNRLPFGETVKGWAFMELIGMIIVNNRAVAKGLKV